MNSFKQTPPMLINEAVFNVCLRYKVIREDAFDQGTYYDVQTSHPFISTINKMRQIGESIQLGSGHATWNEYGNLITIFLQTLSKAKGISIEAAQEILATEVEAIKNLIAEAQRQASAQQKVAQHNAEEMKKIIRGMLYTMAISGVVLIVFLVIRYVAEKAEERFLNRTEAEAVQLENYLLVEENEALSTKAAQFEQFTKERNTLEALKAENAGLRQRNSDLNDRIIQCKKPFWKRVCN